MMNSQEFLDALISRLSDDTIYGSSLGRTAVLMNQYRPAQTLFLDSMGDATATMLGLAIALKEKCSVVAVDTDGCFLMNLSVLPMLGTLLPTLPSARLVILDNEIYESAGGLPSRSSPLDWVQLFGAVRRMFFGVPFHYALSISSPTKKLDVKECFRLLLP